MKLNKIGLYDTIMFRTDNWVRNGTDMFVEPNSS